MSASPPPDPQLPDALEDAVLEILEGDDELRTEALRQLLDDNPRHVRTLRAWLSSAAVELPGDAADPDALPRDLGPYRLVELIGRGGFGTVYRADQQQPIQRAVAIKVINPGMDSREILSRFHAEREALNRMDHPGIARLLDAGTTEQSRPFFVMELVEGPSLAAMCRQRGLGLRQRLDLFLMVLDAMQHAHQKAVIHRDLSSNNVLVGETAGHWQPKIIDFGIAKSLADPLLEGGAMTFQGTLMGTPEFMSPEQAAGRTADIDTRADVYALGVQLFELLTDQLPIPSHILRAHGPAGIAKVIRSHRPSAPSAVATKDKQPALRGDLDAITLRAIEKSREERYASVADLAADIRRHLAHEPVLAGEPSTWLRLRKLIRRHRVESVAIAVVTLVLLAATAVSIWAYLWVDATLSTTTAEKREIERVANESIRLLANEDCLLAAKATADALPAPWPEHREALRAWLDDHGAPLLEERRKLQTKLTEMRDASPDGVFADVTDQHLFAALGRLDLELDAFLGPTGPLQRVRRGVAFLDAVVAPELENRRLLWQQAIADIKATYRGLTLRPLPGLVPLGRNAKSGLHEFRDLASSDAGSAIVFVLIPAGTFRIGAFRGEPGLPQNDPDARDDELNGQLTSLDDFLIARTELTRAQWSALRGAAAPANAAASLPATGIDWHDAREVLGRFDLDLPTEAQWEYACRATTTSPWAIEQVVAQGPTAGRFAAGPQPVASLPANGWGLFDMHGNAAEWCRDPKLPYASQPPRTSDGLRTLEDTAADAPRVVRGGAWLLPRPATRSAARDAHAPDTRNDAIGLRPIRRLR